MLSTDSESSHSSSHDKKNTAFKRFYIYLITSTLPKLSPELPLDDDEVGQAYLECKTVVWENKKKNLIGSSRQKYLEVVTA